MSDLFRPLSMYREIPPATFDGADSYVSSVPPVAQWPTRYGGTARNSSQAKEPGRTLQVRVGVRPGA